MAKKVLIVDDNKMYRDAFKRNLQINGYEVYEAENSDEALQNIEVYDPQVMVTDLDMRTRTEGLVLIKEAKRVKPTMPIVMISAVGTFEEGGLATQFGATYVIAKSNIEEEMEKLYKLIDNSIEKYEKIQSSLKKLNELKSLYYNEGKRDLVLELANILNDKNVDEFVKSETFDFLLTVQGGDIVQGTTREMTKIPGGVGEVTAESLNKRILSEIPEFDTLEEESKQAFRTAEFLFMQQDKFSRDIDFSRNIGFSYCFSVENETKARMKKRLAKFLSSKETMELVNAMYDRGLGHVDLFFHQTILQIQRGREMEFTIDNVKQTLERIIEHESRYKPDGLKAIGILIICFGRNYKLKTAKKEFEVENPLGIKGLDGNDQSIDLAELLINLQHFRNPYIHPEISEMEKTTIIREATVKCLKMICKLQ